MVDKASRNPNSDQKSLQLKLLNYSTAASLALTAGLALPTNKAEAGYACVTPEISPADKTKYYFDFDNDGDKEFWFAYTSGLALGKTIGDGGDVGVSAIVTTGGYAAALNNSYLISASKNFASFNPWRNLISSSVGPWQYANPKYLGMKFTLSEGGTYYGWARVTVNNAIGFPFTIHKYCYNTTSNGSIPAGQSPTAIELANFEASNNASWKLSALGAALMTSIAGLWVWARKRIRSH